MSTIKKWIIRYIIFWCCLMGLIVIGAPYLEPYLIFPGSWARPTPPKLELGVHEEMWTRPLGDDPAKFVEALFLKHPDEKKHGLVIFAHGNGMFIDDWQHALKSYNNFGYHVLIVEFRGYGRSAGAANIENIVDDFKYFYKKATVHPLVDKNDIVYHGWSVGGGIVGRLAAHYPPDKIILNSTFSSLKKVIYEKAKLPDYLVSSELNTINDLNGFLGQIQIHHSKEDELVNYSHAVDLHQGLDNTEIVFHKGTHNTTPKDWDLYWTKVSEFLQKK